MDCLRRKTGIGTGLLLLLGGLCSGVAIQDLLPRTEAHTRALTRAEAIQITQDLQRPNLSLSSGNDELAKVARLLGSSVVHIESRHTNAQGSLMEETGSGVVTALSGTSGLYVVTNRHVVQGTKDLNDILIQFGNGQFLSPTKVWQDPATDIAVLKLPNMDIVPARWGDSDQLEIGHLVMALGSPFGLSQSVTLGIVSAKGRRSLKLGQSSDMLNQDFIQTDAAINPGNSGGPLVDLQGRIVGINTAIASNSGGNEGIAFSIPSNLVRRVAESLVQHGHVPRSYLGVLLDSEFSAETAREFKLNRLRGARILRVYEKTPAAQAALRTDDIVLELNGVEVQDHNHLINLVSLTPVGKTVRLTVLRQGQIGTIDVHLADRSALNAQSSAPAIDLPAPTIAPASHTQQSNNSARLWPIDKNLAAQVGLEPTARGLLVMEVPQNLADAGIEPYDLVIEAARNPILSQVDWRQAWQDVSGESLLVTIRRATPSGPRDQVILWPKSAR